MTRNVFVLFKSFVEMDKNPEKSSFPMVWYANGITVHAKDVKHLKTVDDVAYILEQAGYVQPGMRCNPEVLDYIVIATDYAGGVLVKEFNDFDDEEI